MTLLPLARPRRPRDRVERAHILEVLPNDDVSASPAEEIVVLMANAEEDGRGRVPARALPALCGGQSSV